MNKAKNWVLKETGEQKPHDHVPREWEEGCRRSNTPEWPWKQVGWQTEGGEVCVCGGAVLFVFRFPVIYEAKTPARADGRKAVKNSSGPEHGRHGANRFCFAKNH